MQKIKTGPVRLGMWVQANPIPLASTHVSLMVVIVDRSSYKWHIYKSSSPGERTRAIESSECPPGMENIGWQPQKLRPHQGRSCGAGFWLVLSSDVWLQWSSWSPASRSSRMGLLLQRQWGWQSLGVHWSPCSPLSLLQWSHQSHIAKRPLIGHGDITNATTLQWWGRWTQLGITSP